MHISLENRIVQKYPSIEIGYLVAQVNIRKKEDFIESIKASLPNFLQSLNINSTNFVSHPSIAVWRKIYEEDFHVKPKTYRSSIESLLRRILTGKDLWNISNVVDLYNCCSILTLLPMGGYDLQKISGNIQIRYGKESETFHGIGEKSPTQVTPDHVVYTDDSDVICWLWNHKDAAKTSIDEKSKNVIFFIDAFDNDKVQDAIKQLRDYLEKIGCIHCENGVLNKATPHVVLKGDWSK